MNLAMEFIKHWKIPHVLSSDTRSWFPFFKIFPKGGSKDTIFYLPWTCSEGSGVIWCHMWTHRWLGDFLRVSVQVTSLLGRRPDRKLDVDHKFSLKTSIWKREVALSVGAGGPGLAAKQGILLDIWLAYPSLWGPAYLTPMGSFQTRAFAFQRDLTLSPNRLCRKTRELRKAEVG